MVYVFASSMKLGICELQRNLKETTSSNACLIGFLRPGNATVVYSPTWEENHQYQSWKGSHYPQEETKCPQRWMILFKILQQICKWTGEENKQTDRAPGSFPCHSASQRLRFFLWAHKSSGSSREVAGLPKYCSYTLIQTLWEMQASGISAASCNSSRQEPKLPLPFLGTWSAAWGTQLLATDHSFLSQKRGWIISFPQRL